MLLKFPMSEILINSPAVRKKLYKTIILNSKLCKTIILNSQKISELPKEPTKTFRTIRSYSFFTLHTRSEYFFLGYETFLQVSHWIPISISRGILVQVSNVSKVSNTPTKTYRTIRSYLFYPVYPVEVFFPGL